MKYLAAIPALVGTLLLSACPIQREYNFNYDEKSGWSGGVVIKPVGQK